MARGVAQRLTLRSLVGEVHERVEADDDQVEASVEGDGPHVAVNEMDAPLEPGDFDLLAGEGEHGGREIDARDTATGGGERE